MSRWLILLVCACSSSDVEQQMQCGANGTCPSGFTCYPVDNRCYRNGTVPSADAAPGDAAAAAGGVTLTFSFMGPGNPTLSPVGTPCGDACWRYAPGTSVTITPNPTYSTWIWNGGGCNASGEMPCTVVLNANTTVVMMFCPWHWVIAPFGKDGNAGSCVSPFQTVRHALGLSRSGDTVFLMQGGYTDMSGEAFASQGPLVIPAGVTLASYEIVRGGNAGVGGAGLVSGSDYATLVAGSGATIAGITVTDDSPPAGGRGHGIWVNGDNVLIRRTAVNSNAATGIVLTAAATNVTIVDNDLRFNGIGISSAAGASAKVEGNTILSSIDAGVRYDGGTLDLGGGALASKGGNTISCTRQNDFVTASTSGSVSARTNVWDHVPPSVGCARGDDLCYPAGFAIDVGGATLPGTACP